MSSRQFQILQEEIVRCERCPRLRSHCMEMARIKRRAYLSWDYWGKPVPSFGDPQARLLILGLAPAAHGANRTGRMFTGDRSGDFLYRALHATGFANQPHSVSKDDGLRLTDVIITASARCAPPDNKPTTVELANCRPFFERELALLKNVRGVVVLGQIAFNTYLGVLRQNQQLVGPRPRFGHNVLHQIHSAGPWLLSSYHPSQQNTSTGRLTAEMLEAVFARARKLLAAS